MITQADVDKLEAALARGVLTVRQADGTTITYASAAELLRAIAYAKAQVEAATTAGNVSQSFVTHTRG